MTFTTYEVVGILCIWFVVAIGLAFIIGSMFRNSRKDSSDYSDMPRIKGVVSFKHRAGEMWRRK